MRRFLTLVCFLCLAIPAGVISLSGCTRNPQENYCNGAGYGPKVTDVASLTLTPQIGGISLAYGQTKQIASPTAQTCQGTSATTSGQYLYGTTNNQLVDISPTGSMCAGTWNRNTGGGIADYTTCRPPNPLPSTGGLPYASAYITATINSVVSNPVQVFVHAPVTSVSLAGPTSCLSQTQSAPLDAQACYAASDQTQRLLCAPASVTTAGSPILACPLPAGITSPSAIPACSASIGTLSFAVGTPAVATINSTTNQITAQQPGTTVITASIAGSGSSAGYFSTCPPASIAISLNGNSTGPVTVTQGVTQNLTTSVIDTNNNAITGLSLDYQSTNPIDISASPGGAVNTSFPGQASIFAICQPSTCNPAPINQLGANGTGLSITSNSLPIVVPGTDSEYVWIAAPGQSQYFVTLDMLTGTPASNVRLPYVPNSMVMDQTGNNLYFGSQRELMVVSTGANALSKQDTSAPGVVLAVAPNNSQLLINDQSRQVFYLYNVTTGASTTFSGVGAAAAWTPDSKTLYIVDSASLGGNHSNTFYVYNSNTGWTSCAAGSACAAAFTGAQNLPAQPGVNLAPVAPFESVAVTIPSVGAYLAGNPTVSRTWCPAGTVGSALTYYPQGDDVNVDTDVLAATADGKHMLGAIANGGSISLSDIGVTIPTTQCPGANSGTISALSTGATILGSSITLPGVTAAAAVNKIVPSPASSTSFITYTPQASAAANNLLPFYVTAPGAAGTTGDVTLMNGSAPSTTSTAPLAGTFSPDDTLFFVSTAGDNLLHTINMKTLTDTQQITPNLPACTPVSSGGLDQGCTYTGSGTVVPATVVTVKPRSIT